MKKIFWVILILFFLIMVAIGAFYFVSFKIFPKNIQEESVEAEKIPEITEIKIDPTLLEWEKITESAPWEKRDSHGFIVYKNKIWLMGGVDGTTRMVSPGKVDYGNAPHFSDVWSTDDGINWQLVAEKSPWGERRSMQVINFKEKMWVLGGWGPEFGCKNDVWSSEDGKNWKLETKSAGWSPREGHQALVFQNKIWVIGGVNYSARKAFNDVWSSEDGISWKKITTMAGWSPRWDFSVATFQNKIWLVGGMQLDQKMFNDIWSTDDGINWQLLNNNSPFSPRQCFTTEYDGKLWVIGRLNDITNKGANDVWYSENGIDWEKTKNDPLWAGREDFGAVVFKNKIWIFGGMDKNWAWKNDVWSSKID